MNILNTIAEASQQRLTSIYLRFLACILLYGGFVHLGNLFGWGGTPWLETPLLWRILDIFLLVFNIGVAIALFYRLPISVLILVSGLILFQFIPYTFFRSYFLTQPEDATTLNGLLGTEVLLLLLLFLLIYFKK
ncbi:MAG: hypothetical protein J7647_04865 [Cyanobacteria bacterium SBLK]|nr:hypothetical protein [Cyanobacteria bacterium SBLK]